MSFEEYCSKLGRLSEVKRTILHKLWGEDSGTLSGDWVRSSTLLALTRQKYFDRRTRELRDEKGCDIETKSVNGGHCYRLNSEVIKNANPRFYLSAKEKKLLFALAKNKCQVCGRRMEAGVRGLQADHKIPLIRGGDHETTNWQAVCNECNVGKKRACAGCEEDCEKCPWAFPENVGILTVLRLPALLRDKIESRADGEGQDAIEREIIRLISSATELD
ncbi:MAG: HNH endonuclease signature motif containing protein [Verrucomicrobiales bacterium]|nr:HNH endonuclease signature motif containing protein [Verrucomicrobiales bacterium]